MIDLAQEARQLGLFLTPQQVEQFAHYRALLQEWNERMNLTSITEPEAIQVRHFLDAMSCAAVTGDLNGQRLVDVGSGGGFPGVPLKLLFPRLRLTLVESVGKKARFLQAVAGALQLDEVTILNERAETVGQQTEHREAYDWAAARAVAALPTLLEYLLPLCRIGGHVLAQKGAAAWEEVAAAQSALAVLGGAAPTIHPVQLPGREADHFLIVVKKVQKTPAAYPRRPGRPAKKPL